MFIFERQTHPFLPTRAKKIHRTDVSSYLIASVENEEGKKKVIALLRFQLLDWRRQH